MAEIPSDVGTVAAVIAAIVSIGQTIGLGPRVKRIEAEQKQQGSSLRKVMRRLRIVEDRTTPPPDGPDRPLVIADTGPTARASTSPG